MSMQAINYALTMPVDDPGPRLLLILIAHHINWKTGDMFVSQDELAKEARMSSRSIRNHLVVLEDAGLIVRTQQRDESGRRGVDRIEMPGYLEWQDVLYNGGTIPSPESRRKKPPANSAASDDSNRKNTDNQPEKNGSPTGNSLPVYKEPSLTISEPLGRASAHATQGAARSAQEGEEPRIVLAGDDTWQLWLNWLKDQNQNRAASAFEAEGAMVVYAKRPASTCKLPALAPIEGSDRREALMARRSRKLRDPSDGTVNEIREAP